MELNEGDGRLAGERFLGALNSLLRTVRIHSDNNQRATDVVSHFFRTLNPLFQGGDRVTLRIVRGRFYLEDDRVPVRQEAARLIQGMLSYFEERELPGLCFHASALGAPAAEVLSFARLLDRAGEQEDSLEWIDVRLQKGGFSWVEVAGECEPEVKCAPRDGGEARAGRTDGHVDRAGRVYSNTLVSLKEVVQKLSSGRRPGIQRSLRMVQNMVDLLMEDESVLLALSTIRVYDDYTFIHSVNVAAMALCLGNRIGLGKRSLERLGLCALFHDLGKVEVPREILNKPGKLSDLEFEQMKRHSINSVRQIVKLRAPRDRKARILLPPFEHHLKYDLSGYPKTHRTKPVSLFGRILAIADVFDALTSPRVYRPTAMSPDRAVRMMLDGAGRDFDPLILKVFVDMVGMYPVGTVLQFDTGEQGLVTGRSRGKAWEGPEVVLLVPDGKGGFATGEEIRMDERDPSTGDFRKNVVNTLHPCSLGIQPVEFLIRETGLSRTPAGDPPPPPPSSSRGRQPAPDA